MVLTWNGGWSHNHPLLVRMWPRREEMADKMTEMFAALPETQSFLEEF